MNDALRNVSGRNAKPDSRTDRSASPKTSPRHGKAEPMLIAWHQRLHGAKMAKLSESKT
jgi:hypothetical protein